MNKAFVRESDSSEEYCPHCGAVGQPVQRETVATHVPEAALEQISATANFCPTRQCDVAYFDVFERVILTSLLKQPVWPKDPHAPICACFGLTAGEIDQDIAEGVNTRTRQCVTQAQSPAARCAELAANGRSCVPEVKRYFIQSRQARSAE